MTPKAPATIGPVVVDLRSTILADDEREMLQHPQVGGVIFFSRNYQNRAQLQTLVNDIRAVRPELVLMVDQEGGRVQRFREGFTRLPPLQRLNTVYEQSPAQALTLAHEHGWLMAAEILSVGIDLSLAPVLDCDDSFSDVIGDRAFSADVERVIALGRAYIEGMHQAGMKAVAKHFPGHGQVKHDSHLTLPVSNLPLDAITVGHMRTFTALSGLFTGVMPAHIIFEQVDDKPVGFSPFWLQNVLRDKLGFQGAIFSDDLSMAGAGWAGDYCARADAALSAGCDVILVCNQPAAAAEVLSHLERHASASQHNSKLGLLKASNLSQTDQWASLTASNMWQNCVQNLNQIEV